MSESLGTKAEVSLPFLILFRLWLELAGHEVTVLLHDCFVDGSVVVVRPVRSVEDLVCEIKRSDWRSELPFELESLLR